MAKRLIENEKYKSLITKEDITIDEFITNATAALNEPDEVLEGGDKAIVHMILSSVMLFKENYSGSCTIADVLKSEAYSAMAMNAMRMRDVIEGKVDGKTLTMNDVPTTEDITLYGFQRRQMALVVKNAQDGSLQEIFKNMEEMQKGGNNETN